MTLVRCGRLTWICVSHSPAISKVKRTVYWLFGRWPSNDLWNPMHHRHARHVDRDLELGVFDRLTVRVGERDSGFAFLRLAGGSKSPLDGDRWPSLRRTSETTNAMARFTARGAAASFGQSQKCLWQLPEESCNRTRCKRITVRPRETQYVPSNKAVAEMQGRILVLRVAPAVAWM